MLWMNPHYCIELMHPAYHNSINLTKKVNKAREPLKEGPEWVYQLLSQAHPNQVSFVLLVLSL